MSPVRPAAAYVGQAELADAEAPAPPPDEDPEEPPDEEPDDVEGFAGFGAVDPDPFESAGAFDSLAGEPVFCPLRLSVR